MSNTAYRWFVLLMFLGWGILATPQPSSADRIAAIEQLKAEAFSALRAGHFEQTHQLLREAASRSEDPTLRLMAQWIDQFETQRQEFAAERRKQFEKVVADVHKLLGANKETYAIGAAARAYLLAEDKDQFRQEPWVRELIQRSIDMARQAERDEQWLRALRLYSDLSSIEPTSMQWKDKLKLATRRIRLLVTYAPDHLNALQKSDADERKAVDALLNPDAPAPKTGDDEEDSEDSFRIDWRDTVRGAEKYMLYEALLDTRTNYYRDVEFQDLLRGGLNGIRALITTSGLEVAFPGLNNEQARSMLLGVVDRAIDDSIHARTTNGTIREVVETLLAVNRQSVAIPDQVIVMEFADGALGELDPFSSIIWPSELEEFHKSTQGEFSGVGIQIQSDKDGSLKVVSPLEDSPAYKAGIKAGDIITHINGRNARGITLQQAVKTITGPRGTEVTLRVQSPSGDVREYTIRRQTIKVASVKGWFHRPGGGWDYFIDPDNNIGYLRLTNFTKTTREELDRAVNELKRNHARALILDLRYNPGGLLSAATDVTDKFLPAGVIVSTRADRNTPNQPTIAAAGPDPDECDLPLVVLVNQYSASASEIVSGALKDHRRAKVVGERTFGKGSVQMLFPLGNRQSYLKLTTSHYFLPSDRCIHREENSQDWGVDPDLVIEMTPEQMTAAIEARQELDVLRDVDDQPAARGDGDETARKDPLSSDPQLSAALLLLRMQLAGAEL